MCLLYFPSLFLPADRSPFFLSRRLIPLPPSQPFPFPLCAPNGAFSTSFPFPFLSFFLSLLCVIQLADCITSRLWSVLCSVPVPTAAAVSAVSAADWPNVLFVFFALLYFTLIVFPFPYLAVFSVCVCVVKVALYSLSLVLVCCLLSCSGMLWSLLTLARLPK